MSALGHPLRTVSDRQTLRVCSEIVRGPFEQPCRAACRLAKRYMCAASAFPAVETRRDSSIRTRKWSKNVMYVMVFAFSLRVRRPFKNQRNTNNSIGEPTTLGISGRQTCVGVRAGDRTFLRRTFESQKH